MLEKKHQLLITDKLVALPRINLNERQVFDLELILNGAFAPLQGFLGEDDYLSVLSSMRLRSGALWPIPVVLDMPETSGFKEGDEIILCDHYGNPLALFTIESIYSSRKDKEAEAVFGTRDLFHPGVKILLFNTGRMYFGGRVQGINFSPKYDFTDLRYHPSELKAWFKENGWQKIVAFQTRNPIHRAHYELMRRAAEVTGGKILIHPVIGVTKDGDVDYVTRVKIYQRVHECYMKDFAKLALLPLAMRMAGPREALWHAIIRKNYGCTHLIIGRDHAGPGKDKNDRPFYGEYEAQDLVRRHEQELGIKVVPQEELVYVEELKKYVPKSEVLSHHTAKNLSGTELRGRLARGEKIPEWFSFPEVVDELEKGMQREWQKGLTVFFTGLPSSGKSTIAHILAARLRELQARKITLLDGDVVRLHLSRGLGFSQEDRNLNIERMGFVANEVTRHGGICICAAVAPYEEARAKNRALISRNGTYVEIFVSTPLETCKQRDVKGLYRKAEAGKLQNFTGISDPYEVPRNPEIAIDTTKSSSLDCANQIIKYLQGQHSI